jgi:hypothetical protein
MVKGKLPFRANYLAALHLPDPAQGGRSESISEGQRQRPEPGLILAAKAHRWLWVAVAASSLTGLVSFDPVFPENPNGLSDTRIETVIIQGRAVIAHSDHRQ